MRADVNTTAMSEMIVYSDLSDEHPATSAEDTVEAETAVQSPN